MLGYLLVHLVDIVFLVGLMGYLVIWHLFDAYKLSIQLGLWKVKSRPLRRYGRNFRHVIKVRSLLGRLVTCSRYSMSQRALSW